MTGTYTKLFESIRDGVYRYSFEDGKIIFANQGFVDILGLNCKPADMEGKLLKEVLIYTEKEGMVRELLGKKNEIHGFEYHFKTLKGDDRWVIHDSFLSVDPATNKKVVDALVKDITERKRLEEVLWKTSENYRSLFEDSPISLWEEDFSEIKKYLDALRKGGVKNIRGYFDTHPELLEKCMAMVRLLDVNKRTLMFFKAKDKEDLKNNFKSLFTPEANDTFKEELLAFAEGKRRFEGEANLLTLAGESKYTVIRASIIAGYEKTWASVIVSIIDITDRRLAEEALKISETNYRSIFDTANDGIFVLDIKTNRIIDVNKRGCEMFCYTEEEFLRFDIDTLSDQSLPYTKENLIKFVKKAVGGEPQIFEWLVKDKIGRSFWIEVNLRRAIIGPRYCLLGIVRDINDRKEMEKRLEKIHKVFLNFGPNPDDNINALTAVCGELLHADCALYSRLEEGMLYACGQWNAPSGFKSIDKPSGHICYNIMRRADSNIVVLRHLSKTKYAKTDPNVVLYNLKTYMGCAVKFADTYIGTLCTVYKEDIIPTDQDKKIMELMASAIAVEEERRSADIQLKESELRFRRAVLDSPLPIILHSEDGTIILINKAWTELSGYTQNEIPTISLWTEKAYGAKKKLIRTGIRKLYNIHEPINEGEFVITAKNGAKRTWDFTSTPLGTLPNGKRLVMSVAIDVTERKKAEQQLQTSEMHFRRLFEASHDGILIINAQTGEITDVNPYLQHLLGYSQKDILGKKLWEIGIFKDIAVSKMAFTKLQKKGYIRYEDLPLKRSDGKCIEVEFVSNTYSVDNTKVIQCNIRDISYRKEAEKKITTLNDDLLESNKKLHQLAFRDSHTGVYNHRYLEEAIEAEFARAKRQSDTLSVIMLDIDYFKSINDVYGHQFGDLVLKQFAHQLKKTVRLYDVVIRFGGEEFIIISPGTYRVGALILARRILDSVTLHNFGTKKQSVRIKLSAAVASYPDDPVTRGMDLVDLADKILNKVKEEGGNRVYSSIETRKPASSLHEAEEYGVSEIRYLQDKIDKLTKRGNQSLAEAIFAFAKTIELKDHYTGEHVERTVHYAAEIAGALDLSENEIESIKQAAALHDLGKIGISEKILLKTSKLSKKEFDEIKKHPQIGVDIIRPIQFMHEIIPLILHHHERWDGTGYPAGLKGEEIPIGARIISIADAYQALSSDRPYRKAYSKKQSIEIIQQGAGIQFDPKIVKIFVRILKHEK